MYAADTQSLFLFEDFLDFFVIVLSLFIVILSQNSLDCGFDDARKVGVEFIILGQHGDFPTKLMHLVLSFEELFLLVLYLLFPKEVG